MSEVVVVESETASYKLDYTWKLRKFSLICSEPNDELVPKHTFDEAYWTDEHHHDHGPNPDPPFDWPDEPDYNFVDSNSREKCCLDLEKVKTELISFGEGDCITTWYMTFEKARQHLSLYLHMDSGPWNTTIAYTMSIVDRRGNALHSMKSDGIVSIQPNNYTGFRHFISIPDLYQNKEMYLVGDTLRIKLELSNLLDVYHYPIPVPEENISDDEDYYGDIESFSSYIMSPSPSRPTPTRRGLWAGIVTLTEIGVQFILGYYVYQYLCFVA